ncbi:MAG: Asp-tRNA(Asn)/Glu-tRNA(Gln) amidotransferase subunit GatB [bacterium]
MEYEVVIGLEVHAQLLTRSKIFCGCSTKFGSPPNTQICPVCTGMPGVLPVLNKQAVDYAIAAALATNCQVQRLSRFDRKNYFYPDLPKSYQISQFDLPIALGGYLEIENKLFLTGHPSPGHDEKSRLSPRAGEAPHQYPHSKRLGITRIHMEEDAGKSVHDIGPGSLVDLNRTGVPLIEIVSEPDMRSPEEAKAYLTQLRDILLYLGICDGNMEEGSFRCDANISLRPRGSDKLGTKTEMKNMNSFRFITKALHYEIKRQAALLDAGQTIKQESRLWDEKKGISLSMRSKEESHDYRYFPEPDLLPLIVDEGWVERIRKTLPELPREKRNRFVSQYGIPGYDGEVLTGSQALADYFESCVKLLNQPKLISNWIMGEVLRILKENSLDINEFPVTPDKLAGLLKLVDDGTVGANSAKKALEEAYKTGKDPQEIIRAKGMIQVSDEGEIKKIIQGVIKENPGPVADYKGGKTKTFGFLVGQVMKASRGKANPKVVNQLLKTMLEL